MIKNHGYLKKFEHDFIAKERLAYEQALKIVESLREEAVLLGAFFPKDPLEGIEVDIRIARILNSCLKAL